MSSTTPTPARPRRRGRLGLVVGVAGLVAVLLTDAPPGLGESGWRMAGVAWCMAAWWITQAIALAATALLPLVLYPLLGIGSTSDVAPVYASSLIFLFLGGFLLAIAMERWGLHRRIALHLVLRVGRSPSRLLVGISLAVAFLSMWVSNTATALMLLPVTMAVVRGLAAHARARGEGSVPPVEILGPTFLLVVAYSASAGGVATLVGTPPNIVLAGALDHLVEGGAPGFARWMLVGLPTTAGLLVAILLLVPRLAPPRPLSSLDLGPGGRDVVRRELEELGPLGSGERKVLVVFSLTVVAWLTRESLGVGDWTLPGWSQAFDRPAFFHDATVAIAAALALALLRDRDEEGRSVAVLPWDFAQSRVPWGVLLLFGGGFALAWGIETTGLTEAIGQSLTGLRGAPSVLVVLVVCLGTTFLTEVTSNTATSTVLMPVLAAAAQGLGVAPALLMVPAALSASCAFMLPVATPPNAIVFGSGWIDVGAMARVGVVLNLVGAAWITLVTMLLVRNVLPGLAP